MSRWTRKLTDPIRSRKKNCVLLDGRPRSFSADAVFVSLPSGILSKSQRKDVQNFVCDVCIKGFSRKYRQLRRRRTHTEEKPVTRHVCDKSFTQQTSLTRHIRIHVGTRNIHHKTIHNK
ncbi:hypothetical protein AVEN_265944-1 [Araneus ventricosus]|uniref:C2H2-type domain-containing protein n=1 Tax=Araneus ventricosus TaxID=182803 RepID=A0A4Y2S5Z8_ARAVE|nr:hypothetical protein AVEN_265944-1 [Araneus ventricosus]